MEARRADDTARMPRDVRHLDEPAVVLLVQRPEDAALHRLQAVGQIRNRAVADDVGGVFQKTAIDAAVQRQLDVLRREGRARRGVATASAERALSPLPPLPFPWPSAGSG